jgi:cytochrome P450
MFLHGKGSLTIGIGSDTTGTVLSNVFLNLLTHPEVYDRLRKEIDDAIPAEITAVDPSALSNLPYLQAVMSALSSIG